MSELQKAHLIELSKTDPPTVVGSPVPVQFNPTTLNLRISNHTEGGNAQGQPSRQYIATSTVLTLDLVFDTADEGDTDHPRSVRERTGIVERYVLPQKEGTETPPKLRFQWGEGLSFDGLVSQVTIDFEHFAANGTPLRAKVGLSLTEQDAKYKVVPSSAKAKAPSPGGPLPGMPGSAGLGLSAGLSAGFSAGISVGASLSLSASASVGVALGGETAVDFAARVGLDPTAWRALDVDLGGDLTLQAGVEVGFDASVSASAGIGASAGFSAGAAAPAEASFGLTAGGGAAEGGGFALAAAGGVASAVAATQVVQTATAAGAARQAFAGGDSTAATAAALPRPGLPEQVRTPLASTGMPSPAQQAAAPPAPPPPRVDPRAVSWGFSVPLRPRTGSLAGSQEAPPPVRAVPTVAPWIELPGAPASGRNVGDRGASSRRRSCGCAGSCGCRGGAR
jgi:hypothetical protein